MNSGINLHGCSTTTIHYLIGRSPVDKAHSPKDASFVILRLKYYIYSSHQLSAANIIISDFLIIINNNNNNNCRRPLTIPACCF